MRLERFALVDAMSLHHAAARPNASTVGFLHRARGEWPRVRSFVIGGIAGGIVGDLPYEFFLGDHDRLLSWHALLVNSALSGSALAVGIASGLAAASALYLRKLRWVWSTQLASTLLGAALGGAIAMAGANVFYNAAGTSEPVRVAAWSLFGALIGWALSRVVPNLGGMRAAIGGAAGGAIGCVLFLAVGAVAGGAAARVVGFGALGAAIGAMIALVDAALREAWLEIHYGKGEVRIIGLGSAPTIVGSDPKRTTIYIPGADPADKSFTLREGRVSIEDVATGTRSLVSRDTQITVGDTTLWIRTAAAASVPQPAATLTESSQGATHNVMMFSGKRAIGITPGALLTRGDIAGLEISNPAEAVARVICRDGTKSELGLTNISGFQWHVSRKDGRGGNVLPGETLRLRGGLTIQFDPPGSVTAVTSI